MSLMKFLTNQGDSIDTDVQLQILKNQEMQAQLKLAEAKWIVEMNKLRPCHMYPINLTHDGLQWVCTSGICEDAVGCGESPSAAMVAFDAMWLGNVEGDNKEKVTA